MGSSHKKASAKRMCIICRGSNTLSKLLSPESQKSIRSHSEKKMIDVKETWAKTCIDSVCRILGLSKSHPFKHFFLDASYCQDCIQLLRDIDFTLKSAKALQQQIIGFREDMFVKLGENYEAIENKNDLADVSFKEIESLTNRSKATFQYDEVIKLMFEKLNVIQDSWTSVDFLEQKKLDSRIKVVSVISERIKTEQDSEDESSTEESIRMTRQKQKINYCEDADVITESKSTIKENTDSEGEIFDHEIDPDWNMSDSEVAINDNEEGDLDEKNNSLAHKIRKTFCCSDESCLKSFNNEDNLRVHERQFHKGDPKPYHCKVCDHKYRFRSSLTKHVKAHKISNSVDCPECGKSFMQFSLNIHIRKVHQKQLKWCSFCEKEFENKEELLEHEKSHKDPLEFSNQSVLFCTYESCRKEFDEKEDLKVHVRKVHEGDPKPYHCQFCDQKFRYAASLDEHLKTHNSSRSPVDCPECGKTLMQYNLKDHIRKVHQKNQNVCSFCEKEFENEEALLEHENTHKNSDQPFSCETCDATFTNSLALKQHMRTHSDNGQICDVCGKRFRSFANLRIHRRSHDKSHIGHKCPECGRDCRSKGMLEMHMLVHTTEKKFICDVCGAVFKYEKGLKLHYRKHTGDFRYACKVCGKRFIASHYLTNHEEIHSGILAYECSVCQKKFRSKNSLKQHERTHEPKDPNRKPRIRPNKKGKGYNLDAISTSLVARDITKGLKSVSKARKNVNKRRWAKPSDSSTSADEETNSDSNDKNFGLNSPKKETQTPSSIYFKKEGLTEIGHSSTEILSSQSNMAASLQSIQQQRYYDDLVTIPPTFLSMPNVNVESANFMGYHNPSYSTAHSNS